MSNNWHQKILLKSAKDIFKSSTIYIVLAFILTLWNFILGIKFQWQNITPLSQPTIFVRSFYSAFVFVTLGFVLYIIHFYKILHDILVKRLGQWGLYNAIKAIVWLFLIYISYMYIVPWLFKILNTGISFLFNIANLVLYLLPPVGIALIVSIIYTIMRHNSVKVVNDVKAINKTRNPKKL